MLQPEIRMIFAAIYSIPDTTGPIPYNTSDIPTIAYTITLFIIGNNIPMTSNIKLSKIFLAKNEIFGLLIVFLKIRTVMTTARVKIKPQIARINETLDNVLDNSKGNESEKRGNTLKKSANMELKIRNAPFDKIAILKLVYAFCWSIIMIYLQSNLKWILTEKSSKLG